MTFSAERRTGEKVLTAIHVAPACHTCMRGRSFVRARRPEAVQFRFLESFWCSSGTSISAAEP